MNRFELYIRGIRADVPADSLLLFNYTMEDLKNPAAVKNSYSRQLTLPGTDRNNRIFQSYFRGDAAPGLFDPSKRVPFQIFTDGGHYREGGYVKLNSATRQGKAISYKITLYGGLGEFLYSLSTKADGSAMTLADLRFLAADEADDATAADELNFEITAANVAAAWNAIGSLNPQGLWGVLNFAPCYNGIPDKFDAGRALVAAAKAGLTTVDGDFKTLDGFASVEVGKDIDEWQAKDLRSYLQRPVISVKALFAAICRPVNNGGYTVVLDDRFFQTQNQLYSKAWMTLKQMTKMSMPTVAEVINESDITLIPGSLITASKRYEFNAAGMSSEGTFTLNVELKQFKFQSAVSGTSLYLSCYYNPTTSGATLNYSGFLIQAVAYDPLGNACAGSPVISIATPYRDFQNVEHLLTTEDFATRAGFTPHYEMTDGQYGQAFGGHVEAVAGTTAGDWVWDSVAAQLTMKASRFAYIKVFIDRVQTRQGPDINALYLSRNSINQTVKMVEDDPLRYGLNGVSYSYQTFPDVRSGCLLTKEILLADTMSPAEFLLSYCRRFGLSLRMDTERKIVYIDSRPGHYSDGTVIDIDSRIDRSRAVEVEPLAFDARTYVLKEPSAGAGYAEDYENRYGHPYGSKRFNTGIEFDADTKDVLSSSKFKTAPSVKSRDVTNCNLTIPTEPAGWMPAAFLYGGMKYNLFKPNSNEEKEYAVPAVPANAAITYYDATFKGYDASSRVQLANEKNEGVDGDGVLLLHIGLDPYRFTAYKDIALTDDIPAMFLNGHDQPCWFMSSRVVPDGTDVPGSPLIPLFGRFVFNGTQVVNSLEFGTPAEVDIPGVTIAADSDVYAAFWKRYVRDRYYKGTKVVTCYVNLNGLPVSVELLRRFYWFDGALWVLNKVTDYDINSAGVTKCEFVQVQDKANYMNY